MSDRGSLFAAENVSKTILQFGMVCIAFGCIYQIEYDTHPVNATVAGLDEYGYGKPGMEVIYHLENSNAVRDSGGHPNDVTIETSSDRWYWYLVERGFAITATVFMAVAIVFAAVARRQTPINRWMSAASQGSSSLFATFSWMAALYALWVVMHRDPMAHTSGVGDKPAPCHHGTIQDTPHTTMQLFARNDEHSLTNTMADYFQAQKTGGQVLIDNSALVEWAFALLMPSSLTPMMKATQSAIGKMTSAQKQASRDCLTNTWLGAGALPVKADKTAGQIPITNANGTITHMTQVITPAIISALKQANAGNSGRNPRQTCFWHGSMVVCASPDELATGMQDMSDHGVTYMGWLMLVMLLIPMHHAFYRLLGLSQLNTAGIIPGGSWIKTATGSIVLGLYVLGTGLLFHRFSNGIHTDYHNTISWLAVFLIPNWVTAALLLVYGIVLYARADADAKDSNMHYYRHAQNIAIVFAHASFGLVIYVILVYQADGSTAPLTPDMQQSVTWLWWMFAVPIIIHYAVQEIMEFRNGAGSAYFDRSVA